MEYMTVKDTAKKWGITHRQVQLLCSRGKISNVTRFGQSWAIPKEAEKPRDNRYRNAAEQIEN